MKVGILTWDKAINHGAILQAYALQKVLEELGCKVVLLDYERCEKIYKLGLIGRLKLMKKNLNYYKFLIKINQKRFLKEKGKKFNCFRKKEFLLGKSYNNPSNNLDLTVIGSDMVFDFYEGYNPFMYGKDVKSKRIISYAASFGYTTIDLFNNFENKNEIINLLKKLDAISYRDSNTGDILKKCCGVDGIKVIDPVLLYSFKKEKKEWKRGNWGDKKYIAIYSYDYNMNNKKEVNEIIKFARENKLKIISVGYNHPWCDYVVNADPYEFLDIINNASYVITDTYHGTLFSIVLNKQFCVKVRDNSFKILDVLNDLEINPYLEKSLYEKLNSIKSNPLDYTKVNNKLNDLRKKSLNYLEENIKKCY